MIRITLSELPPTVNHLYRPDGRGGRLLTDEAKAFRWSVFGALCDGGLPEVPAGDLALTLRVVFPDRRRRDLDNLLKAAQDSLAVALNFDDRRIARLVVERTGYERGRPACEMILEAL